jgi:hypothetical protein
MNTDTNVWNEDRSYAPDPFANLAAIEHYEKVARQLRRKSWFDRIVAAIAENFIPAALGLIAGMMLTVGLASVVGAFL